MVGQTVQQYKILEKLGEGGMGVVYKAHDTRLDRMVALKFLRFEQTNNSKITERFLREARVISKLDHPNIAVIHEISETREGQPFICMAYYEGDTLYHLLQQAPLPLNEILNISIQILRGLQKSHEAGIIHRDIKPGNIVFSSDGNLKLVDFGVARLADDVRLTSEGKNPGTLPYMSPEQMRGEDVDSRSDLFSFGIVLYELITGQHPFAGEYEQVIGYKLLNENPTPVRSLKPDIPEELGELVSRCLEKDRNLRYASASEVINDLENIIQNHQLSVATDKRLSPGRLQSNKLNQLAVAIPMPVFGLAAVFVVVFFVILAGNPFRQSDDDPPIPVARHLVVLPFTNLSEDLVPQSFCDGLVETLNSSLTLLQPQDVSYWVVAASEVRQNNTMSVADAQKQFNATLAITGSIQQSSDQFRLILNLVDANTLRQIKSSIIDVPRASLNRLQEKAVLEIAKMLNIDAGSSAVSTVTAGGTPDPRAYEYYIKGKGFLQQFERLENILNSIEQFNLAIMADDRFALAYAGLGEAYMRRYLETRETQWVRPAIENARFAMELNDSHPDIHITFAMVNRVTGNSEDAIQALLSVVERHPLNANAFSELAITYEEIGDFTQAEEAYLKAISLKPAYWAFHNSLGVFYYYRGRYEDAIEKFKDVVELNPGNVRGYTNLGGIYFYLDRRIETAEVLEYSLTIEPTYEAYSNLGTLYYFEGRYEDAVRAYEQALDIQDSDFSVWGYLGSAYRFTDNGKQKSAEAFTRAIELAEENLSVNPRDARLLNRLAGYFANLGKNDEARDYAERAMEVSPGNAVVLGRAAIAFERIGDREKALKLLEEAIQTGFSTDEIERDPDLTEFREDERYIALSKAATNQ